jgi:hypothetical protein
MYPVNGTDLFTRSFEWDQSLDGCRIFRFSWLHLYGAYIHYSLSTTKRPYEWFSLFNGGVSDSEEEGFLNLFSFIWCQFFSKNMCLRNNMWYACRYRIQLERTRRPPWWPHFDRIQPRRRSIRRESDKDATTGGVEAGSNRARTVASRIGGRR